MEKNIIIGVLAVAILGFGVYYIVNTNTSEVANNVVVDDTTKTPVTNNNSTTPPLVITIPEAPIVQTSQNSSVSNSTAVVTGTVNPKGAATSYWFEYGQTTALGTKTVSQNIGSGFFTVSTPAYITGLKTNTVYYFRLSAQNGLGTVNGVSYSLKTNSTPPLVVSIPTSQTLSASSISRTTVNLNGRVNPKGASTSYWFEYGKDINFGSVSSITTLASGNSAVSVVASVTGLDPLTKYYFRLNAQNQYGTVNGSTLNFTTKGPKTNN